MATIDGLPPLREVIRTHELVARKQLGQNFLLDLNLTARIAQVQVEERRQRPEARQRPTAEPTAESVFGSKD